MYTCQKLVSNLPAQDGLLSHDCVHVACCTRTIGWAVVFVHPSCALVCLAQLHAHQNSL